MSEGQDEAEICVLLNGKSCMTISMKCVWPYGKTLPLCDYDANQGRAWSRLGFRSELEFETVKHAVTMMIVFSDVKNAKTRGLGSISSGFWIRSVPWM